MPKLLFQKCNKKLIFGVDYNRAKPPGPPDSISNMYCHSSLTWKYFRSKTNPFWCTLMKIKQ